jgi:hypothetical protein
MYYFIVYLLSLVRTISWRNCLAVYTELCRIMVSLFCQNRLQRPALVRQTVDSVATVVAAAAAVVNRQNVEFFSLLLQ